MKNRTKGEINYNIVGALVIVLLIGIGIGWVARPVPEAEEPMLKVMSLWSGGEEDSFKAVLSGFENETGITVEHIPQTTEGLLTGIPMALMAERTPADVVLAPWPAWIRGLAQEGHLSDVTGLVNVAEYSTTHLDEVKVGGVLYGVPFKMAGKPGFWYKKSFFTANGLTEPTTYDEFKTLLASLKAISGIEAPIASGDGVGWPLSDTTEAFIMGIGGAQLQLDLIDGTKAWTGSEVRTVFDSLTELLQAGYFSTPDEWTGQVTKFWDEKYGIYFMGDWIAGMSDQGVVSDDIDFFGFPGTDGAAGSIDYAFVPKYAEFPDEANELLKYLATPEAQEIWVNRGGYLAPNKEVSLDLYTPVGRTVVEFLGTVRVVSDLDDAVGGTFQTTFWDQLKLLWVDPGALDDVLSAIQAEAP